MKIKISSYIFGTKLTSVDDHLLEFAFRGRSLHDSLVNGVGRHESVDHDRLRLTDTMAPVLGLKVTLGILNNKRKHDRQTDRQRQDRQTD